MKRLINILFAALAAVAVLASCSKYDDTELRNDLAGLTDRIDNLEDVIAGIQSDIATLSEIAEKLESQVTVDEVIDNGGGSYTIRFSDGTEIDLTCGKDGAQGGQGPEGPQGEQGADGVTPPGLIIIDQWGTLCWGYVDENGDEQLLRDADGNSIPAATVTPLLRINPETGMWEISTNGGQWYEDLAPALGGDSHFFKGVDVYATGIYINLANNNSIYIPMAVVNEMFLFFGDGYSNKELVENYGSIEQLEEIVLPYGGITEVRYVKIGSGDVAFAKPDGWAVSLSEVTDTVGYSNEPFFTITVGKVLVTAPVEANPIADTTGEIAAIQTYSTTGKTYVNSIKVRVDPDAVIEKPTVEFTAINLSGDYFGTLESTNANYRFTLGDGNGITYNIDLYADVWDGGETVGIPAGEYTLNSEEDVPGTISAVNSNYFNETEGIYGATFTTATLTVASSGSQYEITLVAEIDGTVHTVIYYGNVSLTDSSVTPPPAGFESDVEIVPTVANSYYKGVKGSLYNFSYEMNGWSNGGYNAILSIVAEIDENRNPLSGTYTISSESAPYTVAIGDGTYASYSSEDYSVMTQAPLVSGTVEISANGITLDAVTENGVKVTGTYSGNIISDAADYPRFPSAGSNVSGSVDLSYDGDVNAYINYYEDYWHITIAPTYMNAGPAIYLDLATGKTLDEGFAGTYTCSSSGEAYTFLPGTSYVNGSDFDNFGTVYYDCEAAMHQGTYATIAGGTVEVTHGAIEEINEWGDKGVVCTIVLNGVDPSGNEIKITYTDITCTIYSSGGNYYNF